MPQDTTVERDSAGQKTVYIVPLQTILVFILDKMHIIKSHNVSGQ